MKHLLLTTIAAVVLVRCGNPEADRALRKAAKEGNIEGVKQHLAIGADVNAKIIFGIAKGMTPLDIANLTANPNKSIETANLLRKHGGKTGEELKAEGK